MKNYKLILEELLLDNELKPIKRKTFEIKYISDDIYDKVFKQTNNEKFMFENMFEKLVDKFIKEKDKVNYIDISKQTDKILNQKVIECFEDLKLSILDISNGWWKCFKDGNQYMTSTDLQSCLEEIIDQKISELKKE